MCQKNRPCDTLLTIHSGGDTNIIGSQVGGEKVDVTADGNLNIASLQDSDLYKASDKSAGISFGTVTRGSVGVSKTDSTYSSVTEQAGIYTGQGGFDITVDGNTDLQGGVISSEATPDKNKLDTGTLTYSNIENKADYSSSSVGVNVGWGKGTEARNQGIIPNVGITAKGDADSTTKSAISPGTITVRDNPNQDLSSLSRDPSGSLNALGKIFDKKTVQEQKELAAVFGEVAFEEIHKISEKNGWKEGSTEKVLLDAFAGGLMAKLGGGNFASGAAGAAFTQMVQDELKKHFADRPDLWQWASLIVGAAAASVVGGDALTGGSTGVSETHNNELLNYDTSGGTLKIRLNNGDTVEVSTKGLTQEQLNAVLDSAGTEIKNLADNTTAMIIVTIAGVATLIYVENKIINGASTLSFTKIATNPTATNVDGEFASSAAQYQRLKESLSLEEIQSVVSTTQHGATQLIQRGFSPSEISSIKLSPDKIMTQSDNAQVFIKNVGDGRYSILVESGNGVVTALKNISENSLNRLAQNYGWK